MLGALPHGRGGGPAPVRPPSSGTAATTGYTPGIRWPWSPTPCRSTAPTSQAVKDTLLICDTTEMADALNRRIHAETIDAAAPVVTAARGHRIARPRRSVVMPPLRTTSISSILRASTHFRYRGDQPRRVVSRPRGDP